MQSMPACVRIKPAWCCQGVRAQSHRHIPRSQVYSFSVTARRKMWGRLRCVKICSLLAVNCCLLARVAEDLVVGHGRPRRGLFYFVAPAVWTDNLALRIFGGVKTLENGSNRTFA